MRPLGRTRAQGFATSASQLPHRLFRDRARHAALTALSKSYSALGRMERGLSRPRIQHLYLHHVFADEIEDFRKLLANLSRDHAFIGYSEALDRISTGAIDRPYLAFSFDDGLKSCLAASAVLREFDVSACFFVVGGMVGAHDHEQIARFCADRLAMPPTEFMSWGDLEQLRADGHEIGSHTMSHRRLSQLGPSEVEAELGESHALLTRRLGTVDHLAWPFGHFSDAPADIIDQGRAAGYISCASGERGVHLRQSDLPTLLLLRDHVIASWPAFHIRYFMARNVERGSRAADLVSS